MRNPLVLRSSAACGGLIIFGTWLYLVLMGNSTSSLVTFLGYTVGTVLLLIACIPVLPARVIALIPVALVLNAVFGEIIGVLAVPLYLDAVGTVLIAALAGPVAATATGGLSAIVWGLFNPAAVPFAATAALVGFLAGIAFRYITQWWHAVLAGLGTGIVSALLAAPVATYVYGGTAGVGTGLVVTGFRALGQNLFQAVTLQSLISDPIDKIIVFLIVFYAMKAMPRRIVQEK